MGVGERIGRSQVGRAVPGALAGSWATARLLVLVSRIAQGVKVAGNLLSDGQTGPHPGALFVDLLLTGLLVDLLG